MAILIHKNLNQREVYHFCNDWVEKIGKILETNYPLSIIRKFTYNFVYLISRLKKDRKTPVIRKLEKKVVKKFDPEIKFLLSVTLGERSNKFDPIVFITLLNSFKTLK